MNRDDIDFRKLPDCPGVYLFRGQRGSVLYAGRATSLRNRVRSYFSDRLGPDRGPRLIEALEKTRTIETVPTDSVLEAYILEAEYIKRYQPRYNVAEKDDTSFQFVVITKEDFPRVLCIRGRSLEQDVSGTAFSDVFGPFPRGGMLKEAMRVLRKILPYRDTCTPRVPGTGKPTRRCFRAQLGLCPGVCDGSVDKKEYAKRIRDLRLFFSGKKKQLISLLEREMRAYAGKREFEKADEIKKRLFSLKHIHDVSLIGKEYAREPDSFRIEAYDIAHTGGTQTVGVMVVFSGSEPLPSAYRTFTVRESAPGDDTGALAEILTRRLRHGEWRFPASLSRTAAPRSCAPRNGCCTGRESAFRSFPS